MRIVDLYAKAWEGIRKGYESGRLAHAYLIAGSPLGEGLQFAESMLKLLFCQSDEKPCDTCEECKRVAAHKHMDILWLEPESKARQIKTEEVRILVQRISQTAYGGGWKAAVILSAECLNENSESVLLKTLEEPSPQSMLLLVTEFPQVLKPTIISRCQRIMLSAGGSARMEKLWKKPVMDLLRRLPPSNGLEAGRLANRLGNVLEMVKKRITESVKEETISDETAIGENKLNDVMDGRINARLREVQSEIFRTMLYWHRDLLMLVEQVDETLLNFPEEIQVIKTQAAKQSVSSALRNIETIEGMFRQINRNIPSTQVLDEAMRKLIP